MSDPQPKPKFTPVDPTQATDGQLDNLATITMEDYVRAIGSADPTLKEFLDATPTL